jgi:signal transduction histidine kinase
MNGGAAWSDIFGVTLRKWADSHFGDSTVPWRWLATYVLLLMLGLTGDFAFCLLAPLPLFWAQIVPALHYIAIVFAAIRFGVAGALVSACIAGLSHVAVLMITCNRTASQSGYLAMFAAVGLVAAWVSERRAPVLLEGGNPPANSTQKRTRNAALPQVGSLTPEFVHQFLTPIASIEGAGFVLEDSDLPNDKRQEFVGIIRKECRRLELLIELLDIRHSRLSDYQEVDVTRLIDEVIASCRSKGDSRIIFRNATRQDVPRLRCEPELIKHAAQVLTTIAIQTISQTGLVELSASLKGYEAIICIGACAEDFSTPFDAAILYNRNAIDLAVVQQILNRHGGSVRMEPRPRGGISMFMILPRESWASV